MGIFANIAAKFRRPNETLVRRQSLLPRLAIDEQFSRIGGGLTPLQVSSIIQEADGGYIHRFIDLLNEARQKDCHLQSLLGTREAALIGLKWNVVPHTIEKRDTEVSQFVEDVLTGAAGEDQVVRSFADFVSHMSGAVYYGFSTSEKSWYRDGKWLKIKGFINHSHRRFRFNTAEGKLVWWDSSMPGNLDGIDLKPSFPDMFVQHQPRVNGDVPAREGLGRVLTWASLFRNWSLSDYLRLAELSWKPWRLGSYKDSASNEDIDDLETALDTLTTNGVGVFSDRAKIDVMWPSGGRGARPEHKVLIDHIGQEMSKCVLGQTLTVESGERGARSLGEVHDRVRKDLRELDAIAIAATITRDIVEPLVRLNFGAGTPLPTFEFVTDDTVDIGELSRAVEGLVRSGVEIPQWWVRDKFGTPEPETGDKLCVGKEVLQAEAGLISTTVSWQGEVIAAPVGASPADDEIEVDIEDDNEDQGDVSGEGGDPGGPGT